MTDDNRGGALLRGLKVLELVCSNRAGFGVSEISRLTGIEKGNVHRILKTLESVGYVSQHAETRKYRGEAEVLALARAALGGMDIIAVARQPMMLISEETGESVHLAQRTRRGGVYVAQKRQPGRITIETEIGAHVGNQNAGKIGICCIGGLERATGPNVGVDNRTMAQKVATLQLIRDIRTRWPKAKVVGHRDLAATQCPGFDVAAWWATANDFPKAPLSLPTTPNAPVLTQTPNWLQTLFDALRALFVRTK
jgi:hypothetical protein